MIYIIYKIVKNVPCALFEYNVKKYFFFKNTTIKLLLFGSAFNAFICISYICMTNVYFGYFYEIFLEIKQKINCQSSEWLSNNIYRMKMKIKF